MTTRTEPGGHPLAALIERAVDGGIIDVYLAKRGEKRYFTEALPLDVRRPVAPAAIPLAAHLASVSPHGIGMVLREPLEPGEIIQVRGWSEANELAWADARVVHVSRGPAGFLVGAQLLVPLPTLPVTLPRNGAAYDCIDAASPQATDLVGAPGGLGWLGAMIGIAAAGGAALIWWFEKALS